MEFSFLTLKFYNIVEFFKKRMYLVYFFIFIHLLLFLYSYLKKQIIIDSSNFYQIYMIKNDNHSLSESKQYGVYFYIKQCLLFKKNIMNQRIFFESFFKYDDVLYKRLFNYYLSLNNFDLSNYDFNLEGGSIWSKLFISVRILNLEYNKSDLENKNLPFFLRVYIGNEDDES